jgi:LAGLIDADG endonuclease
VVKLIKNKKTKKKTKKSKKNSTEFFEFRVEKFEDINKKIIPLFINYPIVGQKLLDFQDFCKVAILMEQKAHLTIEGLNQIELIKKGINRGRVLPA